MWAGEVDIRLPHDVAESLAHTSRGFLIPTKQKELPCNAEARFFYSCYRLQLIFVPASDRFYAVKLPKLLNSLERVLKMKSWLFFLLSTALVSGCRLAPTSAHFEKPHTVRSPKPVDLRSYMEKYNYWRRVLTYRLKLPTAATLDDIRPLVADGLSLPVTASWEDILAEPRVHKFCTEARRSKAAKILNLPESSTWIEILLFMERARSK